MEGGRPWGHVVTFREFDAGGVPRFFGSREPITGMCWIADVESAFHANFCPTEVMVRYAECLLHDGAKD